MGEKKDFQSPSYPFALSPFRILVFAGHSGGHLFPAVAFAEKFREKYPQSRIDLVSSVKARPITDSLPKGTFDEIHFLPEFPSPAGLSVRTLRFLLTFPLAFIQTAFLMKKIKPSLCAGFGSYVSYPGIRISKWMKIPSVIHEQNVVPGKASRMLARYADCAAVSFDETFKDEGLKRREVTGLPLRSAIMPPHSFACHPEPFACHSEPFACHSERSEESALPALEGKLREESASLS